MSPVPVVRAVYTIGEAADMFAVGYESMRRRLLSGEIESVTLGGRLFVPHRVIAEFRGDIPPTAGPAPSATGQEEAA